VGGSGPLREGRAIQKGASAQGESSEKTTRNGGEGGTGRRGGEGAGRRRKGVGRGGAGGGNVCGGGGGGV